MTPQKEWLLTKLLVHYIYLFPIVIILVLFYGMPPKYFEWESHKDLFFWSFVGMSLASLWIGRWLRRRKPSDLGALRIQVLLCAASGELCLILGIMYVLLTNDFRQGSTFVLFWALHYAATLFWLRREKIKS